MKRVAKSAPRSKKTHINSTKEKEQITVTKIRTNLNNKTNKNKLNEKITKSKRSTGNQSIKHKKLNKNNPNNKEKKKKDLPNKISQSDLTPNKTKKVKEYKKRKPKNKEQIEDKPNIIIEKPSKTNKRTKSNIIPDKIVNENNIELRPRLIELEEINNKFLASYTNLDYLLAIIEVVHNKDFYNIPYSDKSKYFWEKVIKTKECDKIFGGFKPETLRKYWVLLSKSSNIPQLTSVIDKIKDNEEVSRIKLKTLVDWLSNLFKNNKEEVNLDRSLPSLFMKEVKVKEKESEKDNSESKRTKKVPSVKKKPVEEKEIRKDEPDNKRRKIYRFVLDEDDIEERQRYLCINELIETLKNIFKQKKYSDSFILDALNINSMNIENTFNYLMNPNANSNFKFI
jgi:hypothetical protein